MMEMIRLNSNFAKVKGVILMILVVIGGALGNMLIMAEEYFDILKAAMCAVIFIILVFLYVHLEHIDPELEIIKTRLGPAIDEMRLPDEDEEPPNGPSEQ